MTILTTDPFSHPDTIALALPEPIHRIRSFVSGDPEGDRLRVSYFANSATQNVFARVWFGPAAEGPPGHAHGGAIAAVLDEIMGVAAWYGGNPVVAARIAVDFLRSVPLEHDVVAHASVVKVEGRRVHVDARIEGPGEPGGPDGLLYATAQGLFIVLDDAMKERLSLALPK